MDPAERERRIAEEAARMVRMSRTRERHKVLLAAALTTFFLVALAGVFGVGAWGLCSLSAVSGVLFILAGWHAVGGGGVAVPIRMNDDDPVDQATLETMSPRQRTGYASGAGLFLIFFGGLVLSALAWTVFTAREPPRPMRVARVAPSARMPAAGECTAGPSLPITPITIEVGTAPTAYMIDELADGEVHHDGRLVARISGSCVLDPKGGVLRSLAMDGTVTGRDAERVGIFREQGALLALGGRPVAVGEALLKVDDSLLAVSDRGGFYKSLSPSMPLVAQQSGMMGDVARARRTALLLYDAAGLIAEWDR